MTEKKLYYALVLSLALHAVIGLAVTLNSRNMAISMPIDMSMIEAILPPKAPEILQSDIPPSYSLPGAEAGGFEVKESASAPKVTVPQPKSQTQASTEPANDAIKEDKKEIAAVQKENSDALSKTDIATPPAEEPQNSANDAIKEDKKEIAAVQKENSDALSKTDISTPPAGETKTTTAFSAQTSQLSVTPPQFGAAYLNNPRPGYPATAKRMGMEGIVTLKVLVSQEGRALKVELFKSSGYSILDTAAAETIKNWLFVPARKGTSPIDEWVNVPVAFRLKK